MAGGGRGVRRGEPEGLGKLLRRVLGELGLDETALVVRAAECWERAAGSEFAAHSRPTALRDGALEVTADSSAWCQELQLASSEILAGLSRELGGDAPTRLWLKCGEP